MFGSLASIVLFTCSPMQAGNLLHPVGAQSTDPAKALAKRAQVWLPALRNSFQGIEANFMIDISDEQLLLWPTRGIRAEKKTDEFVAMMGAMLHRKVVTMNEGAVLVRAPELDDTRCNKIKAATVWLSTVPDRELESLVTTGVPFAYLSPATKFFFERFCDMPGLQQNMSTNGFTCAEVRISFAGSAVDSTGKEKYLVLDELSRFWPSEQKRRASVELGYKPPIPDIDEHRELRKGSLDFSRGDLLQLSDIVQRAASAFGQEITYDSRLARSYYYIEGKFTLDSFMRFVKSATQTSSFEVVPSLLELRRELRGVMNERLPSVLDNKYAPPGMSYSDLFNARIISASDLSKSFPELIEAMAGASIPSNSRFELSPALTFQLVAEGGFVEPGSPPNQSPIGNNWGLTIGFLDGK